MKSNLFTKDNLRIILFLIAGVKSELVYGLLKSKDLLSAVPSNLQSLLFFLPVKA